MATRVSFVSVLDIRELIALIGDLSFSYSFNYQKIHGYVRIENATVVSKYTIHLQISERFKFY